MPANSGVKLYGSFAQFTGKLTPDSNLQCEHALIHDCIRPTLYFSGVHSEDEVQCKSDLFSPALVYQPDLIPPLKYRELRCSPKFGGLHESLL